MSHFTRVKTQITDEECLIAALKDLGFKSQEIVCHKTPQHLYGYQGDKREQKAEIIIPRSAVGASSNDIGFQRQADGSFEAIISDYDRGSPMRQSEFTKGMRGFNQDWLNKLSQRYGLHKVKRELSAQNFYIDSERVNENGEIVLKAYSQ